MEYIHTPYNDLCRILLNNCEIKNISQSESVSSLLLLLLSVSFTDSLSESFVGAKPKLKKVLHFTITVTQCMCGYPLFSSVLSNIILVNFLLFPAGIGEIWALQIHMYLEAALPFLPTPTPACCTAYLALTHPFVNPQRMRRKVTVVILSVCLSVCYHASCYIPHLRVQFAVL